jgi:hypothetical protein
MWSFCYPQPRSYGHVSSIPTEVQRLNRLQEGRRASVYSKRHRQGRRGPGGGVEAKWLV